MFHGQELLVMTSGDSKGNATWVGTLKCTLGTVEEWNSADVKHGGEFGCQLNFSRQQVIH